MLVTSDESAMLIAIEAARKAEAAGDVPIGAVVVKDDEVICIAQNEKELLNDPTAHAEIIAIRNAAKTLNSWRLTGTKLYVTLEPCVMCAGAIVAARFDSVIFGAYDPKGGACGSLYNICDDSRLNHAPEIKGNILGSECGDMLSSFFARLRKS